MVRFSLFGNRNGRKVFRGTQFLIAFLLITIFSTGLSLGVYALIANRWNPTVLLLGLGAGAVVSLMVLLFSWMTPLQRLPVIR